MVFWGPQLMADEFHLTDHQNELIAFALIYMWGSMVDTKRYSIGKGEYRFTIQEIEEILMAMDIDRDTIVDYKIKIMRDEV